MKLIPSKAHSPIAAPMDRITRTWEGTPYLLFSQVPGKGVDCVRFVSGMGDMLLGRPFTKVPRVHSDVGMMNPPMARRTMRFLMELFDMESIAAEDDTIMIQAGDVVAVGPQGGGPGHAMIADGHGRLWHSTPQGVQATGLTTYGMEFHAVLRRKGGWA